MRSITRQRVGEQLLLLEEKIVGDRSRQPADAMAAVGFQGLGRRRARSLDEACAGPSSRSSGRAISPVGLQSADRRRSSTTAGARARVPRVADLLPTFAIQ